MVYQMFVKPDDKVLKHDLRLSKEYLFSFVLHWKQERLIFFKYLMSLF